MAIRSGGDSGQQVCLNAPIADSRAGLTGRSPVGGNLTAVACSASRGMRLEGDQVTSMPWDAQGEAQAAMRAIVADPRYGPAALSDGEAMTTQLKDMLR